MGQRGQLDKLPVAHTASVTSLDWFPAGRAQGSGTIAVPGQSENIGLGWLVSGGFDRCVKVSNQLQYIYTWQILTLYPGMGPHCSKNRQSYTSQTDLYPSSLLCCSPCCMEARI